MIRLVLMVAFLAAIAFVVMGTLQTITRFATGRDESTMPDTFKRIAFGALIILLIGLSTGWLGGM